MVINKIKIKSCEEIPYTLYLYLHSKLYGVFSRKEVNIKEIKKYLRMWRIPRKLRPLIFRELELMNLIKITKRRKAIINKPSFNDESYNYYYKKLGVF